MSRLDRYLTRKTKMLFLETPTNPTLRCVDLEKLAEIARKKGVCVVVDNTFATPILQKPLASGCDISLHSATKYLAAAAMLTAGAVAGPRKWIDPIRAMMIQSGGCLDPGAAYLLIRAEDPGTSGEARMRERNDHRSVAELASKGRACDVSRIART